MHVTPAMRQRERPAAGRHPRCAYEEPAQFAAEERPRPRPQRALAHSSPAARSASASASVNRAAEVSVAASGSCSWRVPMRSAAERRGTAPPAGAGAARRRAVRKTPAGLV